MGKVLKVLGIFLGGMVVNEMISNKLVINDGEIIYEDDEYQIKASKVVVNGYRDARLLMKNQGK